MFSGKVPFAAATGLILPDNFIDKITVAKNFIQKDFDIMHAVPVQMHPNGALISEEVAHIQQPHAYQPETDQCKQHSQPADTRAHLMVGSLNCHLVSLHIVPEKA